MRGSALLDIGVTMINKTQKQSFETETTYGRHFEARSRKLTRENLQSLKNVEGKWSDDWMKSLAGMASTLSSIFALPMGGKNNNMCKNYGHVLKLPMERNQPKCGDCGVVVKHSSQIRASSLVESREKYGFSLTDF